MGNMQATAAAEAVAEGTVTIRQALELNLQSNHFPPIPVVYVDPILEAIAAVEEGYHQRPIPLTAVESTGMLPREARVDEEGRMVVEAGVLLDITHAWAFVDDDEEV